MESAYDTPTNRLTIAKSDINALPLARFEGEIHLIQRDEQLAPALERLRGETVLGFDTETRPSFRPGESYPTALIQLSTETDAFLFQILYLQDLAPLWDLLENRTLLKAGVALRDDLRHLQDRRRFQPGGFLELTEFTRRAGLVNTGLRSLAAYYLGVRVSKSAQVTNWSRRQLATAQTQYAATDAWISLRLFLRLRELGLTEPPLPERTPIEATPAPEPAAEPTSVPAPAAPASPRRRNRGQPPRANR